MHKYLFICQWFNSHHTSSDQFHTVTFISFKRISFSFEFLSQYYFDSGIQKESDKETISCPPQNVRIKGKNDLDEPTTEGTLLRELFFRKPSVDESENLDIIPVLSDTDLQAKPTNSILLP